MQTPAASFATGLQLPPAHESRPTFDPAWARSVKYIMPDGTYGWTMPGHPPPPGAKVLDTPPAHAPATSSPIAFPTATTPMVQSATVPPPSRPAWPTPYNNPFWMRPDAQRMPAHASDAPPGLTPPHTPGFVPQHAPGFVPPHTPAPFYLTQEQIRQCNLDSTRAMLDKIQQLSAECESLRKQLDEAKADIRMLQAMGPPLVRSNATFGQ